MEFYWDFKFTLLILFISFGGCSDREYQRGDEVAWYPDGDTLVRHEYNPLTAYAFGIGFISNYFPPLLVLIDYSVV